MKQVVLKLDIHDIKIKQKAMKVVSGISGVEAVSVDLKDNKMTVKGDVDPVQIVGKLRKFCHTDLVTVGPEPEKKKEEPKKEDPKKPAEVVDKKPENSQYYYVGPPPMYASYTIVHEEEPQGCVIC